MSLIESENKQRIIDRLLSMIGRRLPDSVAELTAFMEIYFAWVPPEDMGDEDGEPEDLYGAALNHWKLFSENRPTNTPLINVYNPDYEQHGWRSTHTIIDVVTDDMPFLVDSLTMEINRRGLTVHRTFHPTVRVDRNDSTISQLSSDSDAGQSESLMHFEIDRQTAGESLNVLQASVERILMDVRRAFEGWQTMRDKLQTILDDLTKEGVPPAARAFVDEDRAFLKWLVEENFIFLGYRQYNLLRRNDNLCLDYVDGTGLGILKERSGVESGRRSIMMPLSSPQARRALSPNLLGLTKTTAFSTVHRPAHMDYLGIKCFDDQGAVVGEHRFLGLFTSLAYSSKPRDIPLLRGKVQRILERSGLPQKSHAGKALAHILDTFPRDEFFQASEDELFDITTGILHLQERQHLRLFTLPDRFKRFVTCIVYVPLDHYNTRTRKRMERVLMKAFGGVNCDFSAKFSESVLVRALFRIWRQPSNAVDVMLDEVPDISVRELEGQLREVMVSWEDKFSRALLEIYGEEQGNVRFYRYHNAFSAAYQSDFKPRTAAYDVQHLEKLSFDHDLGMHFYQTLEDPRDLLHFKVFRVRPAPLSDVMPILENMGLRVLRANPYEVTLSDGSSRWIMDFTMEPHQGQQIDVSSARENFQETFARLQQGEMENDSLNQLVLLAGLSWREVVMLRAYSKYLLQADISYSQAYIRRTLTRYADIARLLVALFHSRFDPDVGSGDRGRRCQLVRGQIDKALDQVVSLDEDRILRRFLNIIGATLRTNFYQPGDHGGYKLYLSFKFESNKIDDLPQPRPMFEIFVYSPRVEAVHLRGGAVARGGLRWSDRLEDFRTEVLGLVKAQMVKNSVIVPVGSKGGFVVKRPSANREILHKEVVECYQTFIRGMLDITDNRDGNNIIEPPRVVRHDRNDPYLVVAADKGTATFSDIANAISKEYRFWLGDAFASGGSDGYDHKKMAITARGAWESVKRHFRELGMDIQNRDPITVLGIGDMAGDVFGNGMLLSRYIRLVAAFNHMHIFIDPDPDSEASYQERQRLFTMPRSNWRDYRKDLLSQGGGIYERSAKSLTLSDRAVEVLGLSRKTFTPTDLIHELLKAPVDLLWNGGIGTYVKAKSESHVDVGDKTNDALRVDGRDLRCKVVGEGGNLGLTQRGRIEYAMQGGRVLTDAVDNSAGVNCSDHEVNIKILLDQVVRNGDMTEKQRNNLLVDMTDEVSSLVLRQNYLQPQAISMMYARGAELIGDHARIIRYMEKGGKLDRALEFLPDDEEIAEREQVGKGLTPPELSVLLAYSKISLYQEILASDVPEDPYLHRHLVAYFPVRLQQSVVAEMGHHPLRREIVATFITNNLLNRMDSAFAYYLWDETGESYPHIVRAYAAAQGMFRMNVLWSAVETLDNQVPAALQTAMLARTQDLLERASLWLLRNRHSPLNIDTVVDQFRGGIEQLRDKLPDLLQDNEQETFQREVNRLVENHVPEELASWVACLDVLYSALDMGEVVRDQQQSMEIVASIYFDLAKRLDLNWLRNSIGSLSASGHWQMRARSALLNSLYDQMRRLTADVLATTGADLASEQRLERWLTSNQERVSRCQAVFADLRGVGDLDLAMLSVAVREIAHLVRGSGDV